MVDGKLELFLSIGGFVVGILGLVLAAVFYLKGKNKKILEYRIRSYHIIGPLSESNSKRLPELKILFDEKPVSMVRSTTITFTNSGNQTITSNDFAKNAQLAIKASKCFLGNEAKFRIDKDNQNSDLFITFSRKNLVEVHFDFLKEKESIKVSFFHDGDIIDVLGELKSGKILKKNTDPIDWEDRLISFYLILFVIGFICLMLYWSNSVRFPMEGFQIVLSAVVLFVFVVGSIYPLIWFIRWLLRKISSILSRKK